MSIKLRLALLLGLLLTGFVVAMAALGFMERTEKVAMEANERQARATLLSHALDFASRALPEYAAEVAQAEEFAPLLPKADTADAQHAIAANLASAGMTALWVVESDGRVRVQVRAADSMPGPEFPLAPAEFARLVAETPSPRFFVEADNRLAEVAVRRLARPGAGNWVVVARHWDERYLRGLAALTGGELALRGPQEMIEVPPDGPRIVLSRTLADWQGHPLRVLRLEYLAADIGRAIATDWREARVLFAFGLLMIAGVWLAIQSWILRPLARISDSLAGDNPQVVTALSAEKSELGRVAQMIRSSFEQRDTLQREIRERTIAQAAREQSEAALRSNLEERSKLGRDLHDGVIQSLYAAGMGLTGIRALLRPDQTEAAARLEQSRTALNETIHDVRNFLIGLEPEALKLQTFSQAVTALLEMMSGIRPFQSRLDIDEDLAGRLTLAQRVHALQIAREAVSNALRHGQAGLIAVSLHGHDGQAEFEITDDGSGFDPAAAGSSGRGLVNFTQRARELDGDLTVHSEPGQGARVKLLFSLSRL